MVEGDHMQSDADPILNIVLQLQVDALLITSSYNSVYML